ncbi:hypothetical protein [Paenibacillus sp. FSL E2-0178]|uniref:hypothetical protein n=1 Tax=Paenibacillus sp. FSL E2-0178 TaxID=2921361 RepID=UPI003158929B
MEIVARARLRPGKDKDLIRAFEELPEHEDKSDVVRKALRLLFFGTPIEKNIEFTCLVEGEESDVKILIDDDKSLDDILDSFLGGI